MTLLYKLAQSEMARAEEPSGSLLLKFLAVISNVHKKLRRCPGSALFSDLYLQQFLLLLEKNVSLSFDFKYAGANLPYTMESSVIFGIHGTKDVAQKETGSQFRVAS